MKIAKYLIVTIVLLSVSSCATVYEVGEVFETDNIESIAIGNTDQTEIIDMFGEPWRKGLSNGNDIFVYTHEKIIFKQNDHVDRQGNTLVIEFNEDKVVENYYLNVPGREAVQFGYFLHKRNHEKQQEINQQNQMVMQ